MAALDSLGKVLTSRTAGMRRKDWPVSGRGELERRSRYHGQEAASTPFEAAEGLAGHARAIRARGCRATPKAKILCAWRARLGDWMRHAMAHETRDFVLGTAWSAGTEVGRRRRRRGRGRERGLLCSSTRRPEAAQFAGAVFPMMGREQKGGPNEASAIELNGRHWRPWDGDGGSERIM